MSQVDFSAVLDDQLTTSEKEDQIRTSIFENQMGEATLVDESNSAIGQMKTVNMSYSVIDPSLEDYWWLKDEFKSADNADSVVKSPASVMRFQKNKYALTQHTAAEIAAGALTAPVEEVQFSNCFTFTRTSTATFINKDGVREIAPINSPRFDYTNGKRQLLLEQAATNLCPNSEFTGGVVGRINYNGVGNTGTWPTNMPSFSFGGASTGYVDIVSITTDSKGRRVMRVSINVVNATGSTQFPRIRFQNSTTGVVAGAVYSAQVYINQVSTSVANFALLEASSAYFGMATSAQLIIGETNVKLTGTYPAAGSTGMIWQIGPSLPTGQTWTCVMDVACPQVEQASRYTSYVPTTGATATRSADSCKFSDKLAALIKKTSVGIVVRGQGIWGASGRIIGTSGAQSRVIGMNSGQTQFGSGSTNFGTVFTVTSPLPAFGAALGWDAGNRSMSYNSGAVLTMASAMDSDGADRYLGRDNGTLMANGWYDELLIYTFKPTNASILAQAKVA